MNSSIIIQSLKDLAVKRPFFWSEADFQFAFSEALRVYLPNARIRLERPVPIKIGKGEKTYYHVDIWIEDEGKLYPIELKYKTMECRIKIEDETFHVTDQSAEDLGRYDYIADIKRIEDIRSQYTSFGEGYAIMLTNNLRYCSNVGNKNITMDKNFRIYDGAILKGQLKWICTPRCNKVNENGDRGSRPVINLFDQYPMQWKDYSKVKDSDGKEICLKSCISVITKLT